MKSLCLGPIPLLVHFLDHQRVEAPLSVLITTMQQLFYPCALRQSPGLLRMALAQVIVVSSMDFISLRIELEESLDFVHIVVIVKLDMGLKLSLCLNALGYQSSTTLLNVST